MAEIIAESGYNVISCDDEYKKLLSEREFISKLSLQFVGVAAPDGSIDKRKLSERVFNNEAELKKLCNRLSRIEGQVRGLREMLEKDVYCTDILIQVSAVNAALNSFSKELLGEHLRTCVADSIRQGNDEVIDELVGVLQKLMK